MKRYTLFLFVMIASVMLSAQTSVLDSFLISTDKTIKAMKRSDSIAAVNDHIWTALLADTNTLKEDPYFLRLEKIDSMDVGPLRGARTFASCPKMFMAMNDTGRVDSSYLRREKGAATPGMRFVEYQNRGDGATLYEMFSAIDSNLNSLCMTQDQIIEIILKYPRIISTGDHGTLFLYKNNNQFYVVRVSYCGDIGVVPSCYCSSVYKIDDPKLWHAMFGTTLVVPSKSHYPNTVMSPLK